METHKMELLKILICDNVYEIEIPEHYLQKTFGTFIRQDGWNKLDRSNWDNGEFFDYQSKPVFTILVDSIRRKVNIATPLTEEEKQNVLNSVEERYRDKSSEEIEEITDRFTKEHARYEQKQLRIKQYCTITAYFLDGIWNWKTTYNEQNLRQSMKREHCKPYLTKYIYTGEKLGICGKMPGEDVFKQLFN